METLESPVPLAFSVIVCRRISGLPAHRRPSQNGTLTAEPPCRNNAVLFAGPRSTCSTRSSFATTLEPVPESTAPSPVELRQPCPRPTPLSLAHGQGRVEPSPKHIGVPTAVSGVSSKMPL